MDEIDTEISIRHAGKRIDDLTRRIERLEGKTFPTAGMVQTCKIEILQDGSIDSLRYTYNGAWSKRMILSREDMEHVDQILEAHGLRWWDGHAE